MKKETKEKLREIPEMSIGFVKGEAFISRAIRWWARYVEGAESDVNHVFIYLGKGKHLIAESIMSGNKIRRLEKYLKRKYEVYIYSKPGLTQEQVMLMKDYLYEALGRKYDFRGLLRFVFKRIPQDPDKNFCSEYAIEVHRAGNNWIPEGLRPSVLQDYVNQEKWNLVFQHKGNKV